MWTSEATEIRARARSVRAGRGELDAQQGLRRENGVGPEAAGGRARVERVRAVRLRVGAVDEDAAAGRQPGVADLEAQRLRALRGERRGPDPGAAGSALQPAASQGPRDADPSPGREIRAARAARGPGRCERPAAWGAAASANPATRRRARSAARRAEAGHAARTPEGRPRSRRNRGTERPRPPGVWRDGTPRVRHGSRQNPSRPRSRPEPREKARSHEENPDRRIAASIRRGI